MSYVNYTNILHFFLCLPNAFIKKFNKTVERYKYNFYIQKVGPKNNKIILRKKDELF